MANQEIIGEAIAGRSASVRKTLIALSTKINSSFLDSAELLYEAQENNYLSLWGFENLGDFAKKELNMKARRAQFLARIVKVYRAVGLSREKIQHLPVSKLREITTLKPEGTYWNREKGVSEPLDEHIVRLLLEADEMSAKELKEEIARLKGQVGPDRRVVRSFSTTESAWENVIKPALELARKKLGTAERDSGGNAVEYADGVCYEVVCADWLSDPNNVEPNELPEEFAGEFAEPELPEEQSSEKTIQLPMEIQI